MINAKLASAMQMRGMSVEKLADLTASSERAVKSWVYGERTPDATKKRWINRIFKEEIYPCTKS